MKDYLNILCCEKTEEFAIKYNEYIKIRNQYYSLSDNDKTELLLPKIKNIINSSTCNFILSSSMAALPVHQWFVTNVQNGINSDSLIFFEISVNKMIELKDKINKVIDDVKNIYTIFPYDYAKLKGVTLEIYLSEFEKIDGVLCSIINSIIKYPDKYILLYGRIKQL
jgi:hypothetical protein